MSFDWTVVSEKKRAVFKEPAIIHFNSPNSGDYKTLPAGEPSGVVTGYIEPIENGVENRYLQINGSNYIEMQPGVKYVGDNYDGGGSVFSKMYYFFSDTAGNAATDIKKAGGYLADGWNETKNKSFFEMLDFAGLNSVKKSIIAAGVVLLVVLLIQIISKIK